MAASVTLWPATVLLFMSRTVTVIVAVVLPSAATGPLGVITTVENEALMAGTNATVGLSSRIITPTVACKVFVPATVDVMIAGVVPLAMTPEAGVTASEDWLGEAVGPAGG